METLQPTESIEKELIPQLTFRHSKINDQDPSIKERLNDAMRAGNNHHIKYHIEFLSDTGIKSVETTVWAAGDKYVCLKGGVWIPIANISRIRMI